MNEMPWSAAQFLVKKLGLPEAIVYATERADPSIRTERGGQFWKNVCAELKAMTPTSAPEDLGDVTDETIRHMRAK